MNNAHKGLEGDHEPVYDYIQEPGNSLKNNRLHKSSYTLESSTQ